MVAELSAFIGKHYRYHLNGLTFHVRVIDARVVYGAIQLCITPATDGNGSKWVSANSLDSEVTLHD